MAMKTQTPEQPRQMTTRELKHHYQAAIDYLDRHYAYFLTHVLGIGRPQWTSAIATAAVGLQEMEEDFKKAAKGQRNKTDEDGVGYDFDFIFNPKFAATLDVPMMAFVLAHETMHIVLNHLKLSDRFVDRVERKRIIEKYNAGETLTRDEIKAIIKQQQAAAKFNIAADAVINDYLEQAGMPVWDNAIRGEAVIGEDASNMTVTDVFERLPEQKGQSAKQCQTCAGTGQKPDDKDQDGKGDKDEQQDGSGQDGQDGEGQKQDGQSGGQGDEQQDGQQGGAGNAHGDGQGEPCPDCNGRGHEHGQGGMPCPDCYGDGDGRGDQAIDSHDWMLDPDFADKIADAIERMEDELEDSGKLPQDIQDKKEEEDTGENSGQKQLQGSMRAGSEEGNIREFQEVHGLSMAWIKLLKEVDPDMFKEPGIAPPPRPYWDRRPRKLGAREFNNVNLPVYRKDEKREKQTTEKPAIVIALDYSSSIGPGDADKFATLARSIPQQRIKLFACTFTTSYKKFDIDNPHGGGNGGTSFDPIVQFIERDVKPELNGNYPKAVVVITDGEAHLAHTPTAEEAESWLWLISPVDRAGSYYPASKTIGRRAMLSEYTNE